MSTLILPQKLRMSHYCIWSLDSANLEAGPEPLLDFLVMVFREFCAAIYLVLGFSFYEGSLAYSGQQKQPDVRFFCCVFQHQPISM